MNNRPRPTMVLCFVLALPVAILLYPLPALAAACAQPCGSPTSGLAGTPKANDALTILRSAVGQLNTCYACECDVAGHNGIQASDALAVLKKAVGLNVKLDCPECSAVSPVNAYERGRAALEAHNIVRADEEFTCSLNANPPGDIEGAVNLFSAVTHVLAYVATHPDAEDFLGLFDGTGSLDFYDFTAAIPHEADVPPASSLREILLGSFDEALTLALERLAVAKADTSFTATVTEGMSPNGWSGSRTSYELDATDAAVLSALLHGVRMGNRIMVAMYHDSTFDELFNDWTQLCAPGYLASNPSFATVVNDAARQIARDEMEAALADIVLALHLVDEEVDAQGNDVLIRADLPSDKYLRDENMVMDLLLASMSVSTPLSTCRSDPLSVRLGRLLETPVNRSDLPEFYFSDDRCLVDKDTFPDLTYNGVLSRPVPIAELEEMAADWYPMCRL